MNIKVGQIDVMRLLRIDPQGKRRLMRQKGIIWAESAKTANLQRNPTIKRKSRRGFRSRTTITRTATSPRRNAIATATTTSRCEVDGLNHLSRLRGRDERSSLLGRRARKSAAGGGSLSTNSSTDYAEAPPPQPSPASKRERERGTADVTHCHQTPPPRSPGYSRYRADARQSRRARV